MIYPFLRLDPDYFTPSKILCLKHEVLSINFLLLCVEAYFGINKVPPSDFYANPINTPDHFLRYYPKIIRLYTGSHDPLRDDCIRFLNRLIKNNLDAKIYEFKYFPHNFLNFAIPTPILESCEVYPYILEEMEKVITNID